MVAARAMRHCFARVAEQAWSDWLIHNPSLQNEPVIARWAIERRPFVIRRPLQEEGLNDDDIPLGLSLPLDLGRRRVALTIAKNSLLSVDVSPTLKDCFWAAPREWLPFLTHLGELADGFSLEMRVFGSLAWERLTGLTYLTPTSDIDLAVLCGQGSMLDALSAFGKAVDRAPVRVDAEFMRSDGKAAHWRELRSDVAEVLLKGGAEGELCDRLDFIEDRL